MRRRPPLLRCCSFLTGLAVLLAALDSGIDGYSEQLLSIHMAQHLLLMLVAPTLLLYGAPLRVALASASPPIRHALGRLLRSRAAHAVASPAVGFAAFALVVLSTHLTGLFELALRHPTVHALEHAAYFWTGMVLLAPLIASDPLPHPPGPVARFAWLTGAMVVMAIPGALLTWGMTVRYSFYLAAARALHRSALADQHLAGVIMWIGGGVLMFVLALTVAMSAMVAEERRQCRRETVDDARRVQAATGAAENLDAVRA